VEWLDLGVCRALWHEGGERTAVVLPGASGGAFQAPVFYLSLALQDVGFSVLTVHDEFDGEERTLVVDLAEPRPPIEVAHATVDKVDGPRQWLRFRRDATTAATLIAEVAALYPLRDLTLEEPAIEDIVRRIYLEGV